MEIILNNKKLRVSYNLATEMAYESLTGRSINYAEIFSDEQEVINLAISCLTANNSDTFDVNDLLLNEDRTEVSVAIKAVIDSMTKWIVVPAIAEQHVPTTEDDGEQNPKD